MIVMLCKFNTMLTCYNVKIITFTRLRTKRQKKINLNKNQKNKCNNSSNLRI